MRSVKVVIEKHVDGYVAYPVGMKGVVVGQGDSLEQARADLQSAIAFHIDTFGSDVFDDDPPVQDAFVTEAAIAA